ncbi:hypothetical protein OIU79_010868 [Salix purpurea]|uniref:DUF642 domain-containing protein n=1 Tax=Salix purpurea TaxID=77065 RepID=A0A9Q0TA98_SALPP|nr:hypothetical protein OIU79_010868 [Salix purpurea]
MYKAITLLVTLGITSPVALSVTDNECMGGWDASAWPFQADEPEVEISIHNPGVEEDVVCDPFIDSDALKLLHYPRVIILISLADELDLNLINLIWFD